MTNVHYINWVMVMTERVNLEPAFVLHSRAYRNSSLILELFTMRHGRVAAIARSARGPRSRYQGKLQLFAPLLISWSGRSDLKNVGNIELNGLAYQLEGTSLLCGFYLNELIMRLIGHEDPFTKVYEQYQTTLNALEKGGFIEPQLRYFEKQLLNELGYGLPLTHDALTGAKIEAQGFYRYLPDRGFVCAEVEDDPAVYPGQLLIDFNQEQVTCTQALKRIKGLMRFVLSRHLGERPVFSRELL